MGKELYESSPSYRNAFDRGCAVLQDREGIDLKKIIFEGPSDLLTETYHAQPALLISNIAFLEHLRVEEGIEPAPEDLMAGHSLGEWTAYVVAGSLTPEEGALAVYWRGRLMKEAFSFEKGSRPMTAILGLPDETVIQACREISRDDSIVVAANFNSPGQVVISGHPDAVKEAAEALRKKGAKISNSFPVGGPFHSPLLASAGGQLSRKLMELGISFREPRNTIISNFTGREIEPTGDHLQSLINQLTGSVLWSASMVRAWELGALEMVSVDVSGNTLLGFAEKIFHRDIPIQPMNPSEPMHRHALRSLAGTLRVKSYPPSPELVRERILKYSPSITAVARIVRELMAQGTPEAIQEALQTLDNDYIVTVQTALRMMQPYENLPEIQQAMSARRLAWPPPEVRDLPMLPLPAEAEDRLRKEFSQALDELQLGPIDEETLLYYVASRWNGDAGKLDAIFKRLRTITRFAGPDYKTQADVRLGMMKYGPEDAEGKQAQGINDWEEVILYVDYDPIVAFPYPGAMAERDKK